MVPNQSFHIQRRSPLHIAPAIAPVFNVIGHLNGILLRAFAGETDAQQTPKLRRIVLLVYHSKQFVSHFFATVFGLTHLTSFSKDVYSPQSYLDFVTWFYVFMSSRVR